MPVKFFKQLKEQEMDKKSTWQQIINAQERSGLTITDYCKEQMISRATFTCWKTKLKKIEPPRSSQFLPVKIKHEVRPFTVKFHDGQVTFITEPPVQWFAGVLKDLQQ